MIWSLKLEKRTVPACKIGRFRWMKKIIGYRSRAPDIYHSESEKSVGNRIIHIWLFKIIMLIRFMITFIE
ncbi:hypothetical protein EJ08DRAFT_654654 [Tothia fuscella]|uniref:Uncharacterized protein n=1 Tax=Tothia fuscella TaxID=1048955 RepID=A0A9P4TRI4_9PEZI|nr:hypothetical protein EJ08DRAFT_654654 [Tothia fuscella]